MVKKIMNVGFTIKNKKMGSVIICGIDSETFLTDIKVGESVFEQNEDIKSMIRYIVREIDRHEDNSYYSIIP